MKNFLLAPFRIHGTELPPNLLLIAKLAVLGLLLKGYHLALPDVFAPIVPLFDGLPAPYLRLTLQTAFAVAAAGVIFNCRVRTCCLILGAVFVLATMANRVYYRNGNVFVGLVFLMVGLDEEKRPGRLLAWQLAVMYFGSGLNKLLEADWRTGQYFDYYLSQIHGSVFYGAVAPLLPAGWLALFLCWSVIATELSAGALFLVPRLRRMAVWLVAGMHAGAAMMVGMDYGIFLAAVLASYLVVLSWPERLVVHWSSGTWTSALVRLHRLSHVSDESVTYEAARPRTLELVADSRRYRGLAAAWRLALWTPALYMVVMAVLTSVRYPWVPRVVRLTGFGVAVILAVALAIWVVKHLPARRRQPVEWAL